MFVPGLEKWCWDVGFLSYYIILRRNWSYRSALTILFHWTVEKSHVLNRRKTCHRYNVLLKLEKRASGFLVWLLVCCMFIFVTQPIGFGKVTEPWMQTENSSFFSFSFCFLSVFFSFVRWKSLTAFQSPRYLQTLIIPENLGSRCPIWLSSSYKL